MSYYLIFQKKSIRGARETLRRIIWSVWIWSQQQSNSNTSSSSSTSPTPITMSRFQSTIDALPRHLLEYEKGIIITMVNAFGLCRFEMNSSNSSSAEEKEDEDVIQERSSTEMANIFLSIYVRCFSAMKVFFNNFNYNLTIILTIYF